MYLPAIQRLHSSVVSSAVREPHIVTPEALEHCNVLEGYVLNLFHDYKLDALGARRSGE